MTEVKLGRAVHLVTQKATARGMQLGLEAIEPETGRLVADRVTDYEGAGIAFQAGDVLFGKLRPYLAKVWCADTSGAAVGDFHVYRPRPELLLPEYLRYTILGRKFLDPVVSSVFGAKMPRADWDFIRNVPIYLPSLDEQRAVVAYLDSETAKVDALVEEQTGLLAVLRERREALVTRAVTKGLNPEAAMTETGIPSLGAIPSHWRVQRVKHLGRAIIGLTYSPDDLVDSDQGGTLVLRAGNIQHGRLAFDDNVYVSTPIPADLCTQAGDILICARNGSARLIGKNAVIGAEAEGETWGAFMAVLRSPSNFYLRWILNSQLFTAQIGLFSTSTINQLTSSTLHNLEVAVPPVDEQQKIADYLDEKTSEVDALIAEAEGIVKVAKERRSALITAAVTGQIDVSGKVA